MYDRKLVYKFGYLLKQADAGIKPMQKIAAGGAMAAAAAGGAAATGGVQLLKELGYPVLAVGAGVPLLTGLLLSEGVHRAGPNKRLREEYGEEILAQKYRTALKDALLQQETANQLKKNQLG